MAAIALLTGMLASLHPAPIAAAATTVPKAHCQPGDTLETGLQGQVPLADRIDGTAARGYTCNLTLVGGHSDFSIPIDLTHNKTAAWGTLDTYASCAYYGQSSAMGVTDVVDASDPAHPVETATLSTSAMKNPWESLRVNQRRGLLVADYNSSPPLDIYDVATDCRHPHLIISTAMPTAQGHEGWFEPDGMVYYMSCDCTGGVWPIDLTDPAHPRELGQWTNLATIHGGSVSSDGMRGYFCQQGIDFATGSQDALLIVDTSDVALRKPHPQARILATLPWPDNAGCQSTYPVSYAGHPYVIQYGETTNPETRHCANNPVTNFSAPRIIDIADERHPRVVSNLMLEVDDPANCGLVQPDYSARSVSFVPQLGAGGALFMYDAHHCSPDRLQDPTILVCAQFLAGLRVYDIRDPAQPRELAYRNMGTVSVTDQSVDDTISRPVVWTDRGVVLFTSEFSGLHVARFEAGLFPLSGPGSCSEYFYAQYNPTACPKTAETGVGATTRTAAGATLPNSGGLPPAALPAAGVGGALVALVGVVTAGRRRRTAQAATSRRVAAEMSRRRSGGPG